MNNDLIRREALKEALKSKFDQDKDDLFVRGYNIGIETAIALLDSALTVTPCDNCIELECENHGVVCPHYTAIKTLKDKPQGKWIIDKNTRDIICSCCGESRRDTRINHIFFCNHCGADMRGGAA